MMEEVCVFGEITQLRYVRLIQYLTRCSDTLFTNAAKLAQHGTWGEMRRIGDT